MIKMKFILAAILFCLLPLGAAQPYLHYTVTDPAIKEMLISMDMPRYTGNVPAEIVAGNWTLILSDGKYIELALVQSSYAIFGKCD